MFVEVSTVAVTAAISLLFVEICFHFVFLVVGLFAVRHPFSSLLFLRYVLYDHLFSIFSLLSVFLLPNLE